jgi:light-regulated signal transduction histidine kinase (bacteriophytochrome)
MESSQSPSGQELAAALEQIEQLKTALEQCSSARQQTEGELARSLDTAQFASQEMQHFIYAVSHDLRTPLRSVSSYAKLLQRQYADNQETSELTSFIVDGAAEMNTLIEDLLKYSRVGTSPRRTLVNVGAIVQFAVMNLQTQIRDSGAKLSISELPEVAVDESQFIQLFQHIIGNALKFRGADPPVIQVAAEEQPQQYVFSITDNGPGIEAKYLETVFAPFKRLHGKEVPGTGLGLAICKKIVRAHGGTMWLESDGQHGSTFKFTVPF